MRFRRLKARLRQSRLHRPSESWRKQPARAENGLVGVHAIFALPLADVIDSVKGFVNIFISVYILLIFAYILTSWIRLPYSVWLNRIQRFLYDVCEPYLRIFRRLLPAFGPLDLSPIVAVISLFLINSIIQTVLDQLH